MVAFPDPDGHLYPRVTSFAEILSNLPHRVDLQDGRPANVVIREAELDEIAGLVAKHRLEG